MITSMTFRPQAGLSLIELMVSLLIASFVLGGVVSVVVSSRGTYETEEEASFIQENARYAMETVARDLRAAGNLGCASLDNVQAANVVDIGAGTALDGFLSFQGINGYEGTLAVAGFPPVIDDLAAGSDAVIIRYADVDSAVAAGDHVAGLERFNLHSAATFSIGDKLLAVDANCRRVALFENTSITPASVSHAAGAGSPGNCTNFLFPEGVNPTDCSAIDVSGNAFSEGSVLMSYVANAYFIDDSNVIPGMPSLKRRVLTTTGVRTEELAQGVESLELTYGVDADGDGNPNAYMDADDVAAADWANVVAVHVSLVFRSQSEILEDARVITLNGVSYNDRFMRQFTASTVKLRNR